MAMRMVILLCATTAAMLLATPISSAEVIRLDIQPGLSGGGGTPYGTNCSYTVTAVVPNPASGQQVTFFDSAGGFFRPSNPLPPTGMSATVSWTPTATGWHTISASQFGTAPVSIDILVGTGLPVGSSCNVLP
jgi:hypothetical protein